MTDLLTSIDVALTAQAVAAIRKETTLTEDDARGVLAVALSGDQSALQDLLDGYEAMGQAPNRSVWQTIGNALLEIAPYAEAATVILGLVGAVKAL